MSAFALTILGAGALMLWSAITGESLLVAIREVLSGAERSGETIGKGTDPDEPPADDEPPKSSGKWARPMNGSMPGPSGKFGACRPIGACTRRHEGIDIGAPSGTPVYASAAGRVSRAGWNGGYGNVVYLEHGSGFQTRYAHLSAFDCRVGDTVNVGELVGRCGSTGASTGPHLHFEIRQAGRALDPLPLIGGW